MAHEGHWDESYFRQVGLADLADQLRDRQDCPAGHGLGTGLTPQAARNSASMSARGRRGPDRCPCWRPRHGGGIRHDGNGVCAGYALHHGEQRRADLHPGVWGPYQARWFRPLAERGRSVQCRRGYPPDRVVPPRSLGSTRSRRFPWSVGTGSPRRPCCREDRLIVGSLSFGRGPCCRAGLLGNRSPYAARMPRGDRGARDGARSRQPCVPLRRRHLGLGYGLRQIIEAGRAQGAVIDTIALSGGAGRRPLVRQLLADCTGMPVAISRQAEPVLLGAAMLGATASGTFADLATAMQEMTGSSDIFLPATCGTIAAQHEQRFLFRDIAESLPRHPHSNNGELSWPVCVSGTWTVAFGAPKSSR